MSKYQSTQTNNRTESWETLCPLTDLEKQSIQIIQKSLSKPSTTPSFKLKSHLNTPNSTRPSSPSNKSSLLKIKHSTSNLSLHKLSFNQFQTDQKTKINSKSQVLENDHDHEEEEEDEIEVHEPIQTIEDFNDWYQNISKMIEIDSESTYQTHLFKLKTYTTTCEKLLNQISLSEGYLKEIKANWKLVDENSRSLERSSEGMLVDQKLLSQLQLELFEKLNYFRRLDEAQKLLSINAEIEIVRSDEFLPMLDQLDLCLEFMKSNRHFRDADLYLVRFQQCLTRSMTLIKLHFINTIRTLFTSVNEKLNSIQDHHDSPSLQALLYKKFENHLNELKPLLFELEKRSIKDSEEYLSILNECFSNWFSIRKNLLNSKIKTQIERISIENYQLKDLIKLTNTGCSYLRQVCTDEFKLFKQFFQYSGDDEVFSYLESLCDYLYDLLRPQILHESNLETLCELATIVNSLIAIDSDLMDEDPPNSSHPDFPAPSKPFKFSTLLNPILQDIQTRLIFRSQSIIQIEVANYSPKLVDLDYPNKLIKKSDGEKSEMSGMKKSWLSDERRDDEDHNEEVALRFRLPLDDVQELWYPTLRKTLWVLSKLHTYVNVSTKETLRFEFIL
ncbi:Sec34-like family-domain-containing protein [Melampsora americana]|nr:Sec34-like family-domain-containing protein [Melampsora americana]